MSPAGAATPATLGVEGISLAQYAAVKAARAEGFPLLEVFRVEGISAAAWSTAEPLWRLRLVDDRQAFALYEAELAQAEDWLDREVTPLRSDLAAWFKFLNVYSAHPRPVDFLRVSKLGMNDVSRLKRRWEERARNDASLPAQIAKLRERPPAPLPPILVQPAVLRRSRGTAPVEPKHPEKPPAAGLAALADTNLAPGKLRFYRYVSIKASLANSPGDEARVLERFGVVDFGALDAGWQALIREDPALAREYRVLLDAQRTKPRSAPRHDRDDTSIAPPSSRVVPFSDAVPAPGASPLTPPASSAREPRPSLAGTVAAAEVPSKSPLPFAPPAVGAAPLLTLEQHASLACEIDEAPERALEAVARYRLTPAQKAAADKHYAERFAREPGLREAWDRAYQTYLDWMRQGRGEAQSMKAAEQDGSRTAAADLAGTLPLEPSNSFEMSRRPALPFSEATRVPQEVAATSIAPKRAPALPDLPARVALTGTSLALPGPLVLTLPFSAQPVESDAAGHRPSRSDPADVAPADGARTDLRATLDTVQFPRGPASSFVTAERDPGGGAPAWPRLAQKAASVDPSASSGGAAPLAVLSGAIDIMHGPRAAVLPFDAAPALSLEDYARFRARLAVKGEDDAETLRYYGIPSPLIKAALQETFAARFRQDPAAQRSFVELVQRFVAELREHATTR